MTRSGFCPLWTLFKPRDGADFDFDFYLPAETMPPPSPPHLSP